MIAVDNQWQIDVASFGDIPGILALSRQIMDTSPLPESAIRTMITRHPTALRVLRVDQTPVGYYLMFLLNKDTYEMALSGQVSVTDLIDHHCGCTGEGVCYLLFHSIVVDLKDPRRNDFTKYMARDIAETIINLVVKQHINVKEVGTVAYTKKGIRFASGFGLARSSINDDNLPVFRISREALLVELSNILINA